MYICKNLYKNRYHLKTSFGETFLQSLISGLCNVSDYSLITANKASENIMVGENNSHNPIDFAHFELALRGFQ